jgi:dinuclear metal center YbgI/SA1388 family protein
MVQQGSARISEIVQHLSMHAPLSAAEDWDPVGLLVGDPSASTRSVVVSIDLTQEVIELALEKQAGLIVTHHPCIFPKNAPIECLVKGSLLYSVLEKKIAVASFHTNFDRSALEVAHEVAEGLGFQEHGRLLDGPGFTTEMIYGTGYGVWGKFADPLPFEDFSKRILELFALKGFWMTASAPSWVSQVGFVAGKGSSFLESAISSGCDLFVTGEVGYHCSLSGLNRGVCVLELGHRESECFFGAIIKKWLAPWGLCVVEVNTSKQMFWQEVVRS